MAALFDIKNVKYAEAVDPSSPWQVSGEVTLFGLRYFGPTCVIAVVTSPNGGIITSGTTTFGSFTMNFKNGFTGTGKYNLTLRVYLGPTWEFSQNFLWFHESGTIPPFPNVAEEKYTFTVSTQATAQSVSKASVVYNNNQTTVNSGTAVPAVITIQNNGTASIQPQFRLDLRKTGATHNEGAYVTAPVIAAGKTGTVNVSSIPVPTDWGNGQTFNAIVVLKGAEGDWDTSPQLSVFKASGVTPEGTGHIILPIKANYDSKIATNAPLPVSFALTGKGDTLMIVFAVANDSSASQPVKATATITGPSGVSMQSWSATMSGNSTTGQIKLTFPASAFLANGTYTVDVELYVNGPAVDAQSSSFTVAGSTVTGLPTLIASYANAVVSYSFTGMTPGGTVQVSIGGTDFYINVNADGTGSGSGTLPTPGAGNYTLMAVDETTSKMANATLTVPSSGTITPIYSVGQSIEDPLTGNVYLITSINTVGQFYECTTTAYGGTSAAQIDWVVGNSYTLVSGTTGTSGTLSASYSGGVVSFSFTGFQPNSAVTLMVLQTGGSLTYKANSSGAGSSAFTDNDAAGTYTLKATDSYGHSATATFTISGSGGPGIVSKDVVIYNNHVANIDSGQPIIVQVVWTNIGGQPIAPRFRVDIQGTGAFDSVLEGQWVSSPAGQAGQTVAVDVSSIPIPTDWQNGKTLHAYVMLEGVSGHWDTASNLFSVIKGSVPSPTLYATYAGGVVYFSFSGFKANALVTLRIIQTGTTYTMNADTTGSGTQTFVYTSYAGTYTLSATDAYGHSANANFTIS